jgi:hypothetical protein
VTQPASREPQPAPLGVEAGQHLGHGQADQLGVGEARGSAEALANPEQAEEVVDCDVECGDEGVEFWWHTPYLGALALLVTACPPSVAHLEAIIF